MRLLRWAILVLSFFLDVHVRADVIQAEAGKKSVQIGSAQLVLDGGGLLENQDGFHLVRGNLYVAAESGTTEIKTPFGLARCEGACMALFERAKDHVWIRSLDGEWIIRRTGDEQLYRLPTAMQLRLAEVGDDGLAQMDFPQSLPWAPTLKSWGHLFPGPLASFKEQVDVFRPRWKVAVEQASEIHQAGARRTLASHEKMLADQERARRAEERESEQLRQLFREKNYLNP